MMKNVLRETDTLDTFVDSSWYFLRFCSLNNEDYGFDIDELIIGCQLINISVVLNMLFYILLYSRFFMQAISYQNKDFKLKEPFDGLFTQGMVCHETYKDQNNKWLSPEEVVHKKVKSILKKKNQMKKLNRSFRIYV